ncbi:MAG: phenylalanine--tRNA ligase subunit alpha [Candidatus Aenigmarchaeota archaeon]|nr:phenylalanine--tRNA ligase subunit alpha [Candidatus Aenigmarchaeota archaeon]
MRSLRPSGKHGNYRLTEEGLRYLKQGLPEVRLVRILKKPMPVDAVRKKVGNFNVALSWAKKNGWVRIDKGKIVLVKKAGDTGVQESLRKLHDGHATTEGELRILISRNLASKERQSLKKAMSLAGKEVTTLTPELIKTGLWRKTRLRPYDVKVTGEKLHPGKRQPYNRFLMQVRRKLVELGFKEMTGPIIETEFWNFDALFQAQNHPSRDWSQTYTLKNPKQGDLPGKKIVSQVQAAHENGWKTGSTGWGYKWDPVKAAQLMPRAHDTAISPRYLSGFSGKVEIPGKYFSLVRCFRPDVIDATHGVEFNQLGGIVIDKDLTLMDLFGLLKEFVQEITGLSEVRFRPDYFPFTEPSVEISAKHPEMGWMELAGAGIFRPELTEPLGVKEPVIAWGFGIDRLAMLRLNIKDIRELFSQNLEWLRESKVTI